jgi:hypothetical protein
MRLILIMLRILIGLLVALALVVERPVVATLLGAPNLDYYCRAALVVAMIVALLLAWGYKRKIEASRHYLQAEKILAQAEATAKRRERACMLLEEKLKAGAVDKERVLVEQIETLRREHQDRVTLLQTENEQLKQTVAKLVKRLQRQSPTAEPEQRPERPA